MAVFVTQNHFEYELKEEKLNLFKRADYIMNNNNSIHNYVYKWKDYVNEKKLLKKAVMYDHYYVKKYALYQWLLFCKHRKKNKRLKYINYIKNRYFKLKKAFSHWCKWCKYKKSQNTIYNAYRLNISKSYIEKWRLYTSKKRYIRQLQRRGWLWQRRILLIKYISIWVEEYNKALVIKPYILALKKIQHKLRIKNCFLIWKGKLKTLRNQRKRYNILIVSCCNIAKRNALVKWKGFTFIAQQYNNKIERIIRCYKLLYLRYAFSKWLNYSVESNLHDIAIIVTKRTYLNRWRKYIILSKGKHLHQIHLSKIVQYYLQSWKSQIYHHQLLSQIFVRKLKHLYIKRWQNRIEQRYQRKKRIWNGYRNAQLKRSIIIWKKYCLAKHYKQYTLNLAVMFNKRYIMNKYLKIMKGIINEKDMYRTALNYMKFKYLRYWKSMIRYKKNYKHNYNRAVYNCNMNRLKFTYYGWIKYTKQSNNYTKNSTKTLKYIQQKLLIKRMFKHWKEEYSSKIQHNRKKLVYFFNIWKQLWSYNKQYNKLEVMCVNEMKRMMRPLYIHKYFYYLQQAYKIVKFQKKYERYKLKYVIKHWYDITIDQKYQLKNTVISLNYWSYHLQGNMFRKWKTAVQDLQIAKLKYANISDETRGLIVQSRSIRNRIRNRIRPRIHNY